MVGRAGSESEEPVVRCGAAAPHRYRISIGGHLGRLAQDAFADMEIEYAAGCTDLCGTFDQAALFDVIARVQALALQLVEVRRDDWNG